MKTTMPAHTALYLADAMLAGVSTDKVTPVITGVNLTRHGKALRATVTDRYRVHQVTLDAAVTTSTKDESALIPSSVFTWITRTLRIVAPRSRGDKAVVEIATHKIPDVPTRRRVSVTILVGDDKVILTTATIPGNFPPVARLIDEAEAAEQYTGPVALKLGFISKMEKLNPEAHAAGRFKHTAAPDSNRPGPVLVTYDADGIAARGLVQPNLILR